jgi:hypothetical protein
MNKPKVNSEGQKSLDRAEEVLSHFQSKTKEFNPFTGLNDISVDEPQTKLSKQELAHTDAIWVEPIRSIKRPVGGKDKATVHFKEEWKPLHEKDWEYVRCIVENNELIGEAVEVWTGKWGCDPAHFWKIPVNKPVMIPRHLAEQLSKCKYHRLKMEGGLEAAQESNFVNKRIVADHVVRRIDCRPDGFGFAA